MTSLDDHVSCTDPSTFVELMLMFDSRLSWLPLPRPLVGPRDGQRSSLLKLARQAEGEPGRGELPAKRRYIISLVVDINNPH